MNRLFLRVTAGEPGAASVSTAAADKMPLNVKLREIKPPKEERGKTHF